MGKALMMTGDLEESEKAFFLGIRQVRYQALEMCNSHKEVSLREYRVLETCLETCHFLGGVLRAIWCKQPVSRIDFIRHVGFLPLVRPCFERLAFCHSGPLSRRPPKPQGLPRRDSKLGDYQSSPGECQKESRWVRVVGYFSVYLRMFSPYPYL